MTEITFRSDMTVKLLDSMGDDNSIVRRARVSTAGAKGVTKNMPGSELSDADKGLINMLYRDRHGVPFEGVEFEFYFEVPIFVSRQIVKHRLSSINESSGRYSVLDGVFYIPSADRPIEQVGKTSEYIFEMGSSEKLLRLQNRQKRASQVSWESYEESLADGVAKEIARTTLPHNIYSSMYYKTNLRSLFNFLSLRKEWGGESLYPSHPQHEIALLADAIAVEVERVVPYAYKAFLEHGMRPV